MLYSARHIERISTGYTAVVPAFCTLVTAVTASIFGVMERVCSRVCLGEVLGVTATSATCVVSTRVFELHR